MKAIFLTSGPNFYEKSNEEYKAVKLTNINLVKELKSSLDRYQSLLFICSDPSDYESNEKYAALIEKSLSLAGIKFVMSDILDERNWLFTRSLVNNADLIVLMGGDPLLQMEFFNNIELKEKISKFKGVIMGISAGSINMASNAYCSQDKKIPESVYYKGLGCTNINIEPHFSLSDKKRIDNILLKDSHKSSFIALNDESFVLIKNNKATLFGNGYYFNNGQYQKINDLKEIDKEK